MTDKEARERLERAFLGQGSVWTKEDATSRLVDAVRRKDLDLEFERDRSHLDLEPFADDPASILRLSSEFVDDVSSIIRRFSVLDEIGPVTSQALDQDQLRNYLLGTGNVPDYDAFAASFDPAFRTDVVTFTQPTTLLRIYGGESKAIGRYFFCCVWPAPGQLPATQGAARWSDASGLATPRENLRRHLAVAIIPAGTTAIIGIVADNFADQLGRFEKGGNTQVFIPQAKNFPFQEYRRAGDDGAVTEIAVQSDDRILRFRR